MLFVQLSKKHLKWAYKLWCESGEGCFFFELLLLPFKQIFKMQKTFMEIHFMAAAAMAVKKSVQKTGKWTDYKVMRLQERAMD